MVATRLTKPPALEPDLISLMQDGMAQIVTKTTGRMDNRGGVPKPDYYGRMAWAFVTHTPLEGDMGWDAHLFVKQGKRGSMRRPFLKLIVTRTGIDIEAATLALYAHCCEELVPGSLDKSETAS